MRKSLVLLILLAALLSSCGREAAPSGVRDPAETASGTAADPASLPELDIGGALASALSVPSVSAASGEVPESSMASQTQTTAPAETTSAAAQLSTAPAGTASSAVSTTPAVVPSAAATKTVTVTTTTTTTKYAAATKASTTTKSTAATSSAATAKTIVTTTASTAKPTEAAVRFSIDGSAAAPYGYEVSLPEEVMTLRQGESVYDLLLRSGAEVEAGKSFLGVYVSSIGGLKEKACGSSSGWVFEVNGQRPAASCDKYQPKSGDIVRWRYSLSP